MNLWDRTKALTYGGKSKNRGEWGRNSQEVVDGTNTDMTTFEVDLYSAYIASRTDRLITMFLPNPITTESFKSIKDPIDYITTEDTFTEFLNEQKQLKVFAKLFREVIQDGASCLYALANNSKWRIRSTKDFKVSTEDIPRYIYVKTEHAITQTVKEKDKEQTGCPVYYRFDTENKKAELVADLEGDGNVKDFEPVVMDDEVKNLLGTDQVEYEQASFQVFKYREDAESIFKKIECKKEMLNSMGSSLHKEVEVSTTGLIMDSKKFANGHEGVKKFIKDQRFWKRTIVKFAYGTGSNQYSNPVDMWNPQPRTELLQKNIETEQHAMDEATQMYRTIGSDGKSNNKGNVQEKQYNTPSFNLIFDLLKTMDIYLNQWWSNIKPNEQLTFGLSLPIKKEVENIFTPMEQVQGGEKDESPRPTDQD